MYINSCWPTSLPFALPSIPTRFRTHKKCYTTVGSLQMKTRRAKRIGKGSNGLKNHATIYLIDLC